MKSMLQQGAFAAAAFVAIIGSSQSAQAQAPTAPTASSAPTPAQAQLVRILTGMGYAPTIAQGGVFYTSPRNYTHYLYPSSDGVTYAYIAFAVIPPEKKAQTPYVELMGWGTKYNSYFTIYASKASPPTMKIEINQACGSGAPDAATLLKCNSAIEADADGSRPLWDPTMWK